MKNNNFTEALKNKKLLIAASFTDVSSGETIYEAFDNGLDIAEIRFDLFQDQTIESAKKLINIIGDLPKILTIRTHLEGGGWRKEEGKRLELYKELIPYVDAIDIELVSDEINDEILNFARKNDVVKILSYHNFDNTPDILVLKKIINEMSSKNPDIYKLATNIENNEELNFFKELAENNKDKNLILIGMGEKGVVSRTKLAKEYSVITFCSVQESTAPGQISLSEMVKALT